MFELYYIDLATGLRRGELLGLKWSDIDLDKGIIHVRRQILRQSGEVVEAPLKTKNSYRNIAIGADTLPRLPSHILGAGPAKRSRRENPLRQAGSLQRRVYPGHLRPRHHLHAEAGGESADMNTKSYAIYTSADGTDFQEVRSVTRNTAGTTHDTFAPVEAQFVKVVINKPTQGSDSAARIYEIEVYGLKK